MFCDSKGKMTSGTWTKTTFDFRVQVQKVTVCPLVAALDKFTNFKISAKICYKI